MRSRVLIGLLLVGGVLAGVVLAGPAGAVRQAGAASTTPKSVSVSVHFPIPPANTASIEVVTIKATVLAGKKLGSVSVRTTRDPHLQNESIVYLIQAPRKRAARPTLKVYALIMYTSLARDLPRSATAAATGSLDATVTTQTVSKETTLKVSEEKSCFGIEEFDSLFESGATVVNAGNATFTLRSALPKSKQGSPPEEVLDNLIANSWQKQRCYGKPEGDDPGAR